MSSEHAHKICRVIFYEVIKKNLFQITFPIFLGGVPSKREYQQAIPLCLPNNCTWDSETGQYVQTEEERRSLYVVEEALEQLRKIKGKFLSECSLFNGIVLLFFIDLEGPLGRRS